MRLDSDQGRQDADGETGGDGPLGEAEAEMIRRYVTDRGGVKAALEEARKYLRKAREHLVPFPETAARRSLELLVDFIAERDW